jgi:hypothetical protein
MNQWENFHILQLNDLNQLVQEQQAPEHNPVIQAKHPAAATPRRG